jgi:hypothetical protein
MEILTWLQAWYVARCDGEWEFREGIKLLSVSNPGWSIEINVSDTPLEDACIPLTQFHQSANDWYGYFLEDALFVGSGDPTKLEVILQVFRSIIEDGLPVASSATGS